MREANLLEHIRRTSGAPPAGVILGPGDDAAAVETGGGGTLLLTVDHLIEGRHVAIGTDLDAAARKAVARSVSDIAAMGGVPRWSLGTGALPKGMSHEDATRLCDRLHTWAAHFGCPMVGGDLASFDGPMTLTVTVGGEANAFTGPITRGGARAGDRVYVTGTLGGSVSSGRHLTFEPRVAEALWLARSLRSSLHAMIDLSDGLGVDAARVASMSGVRFSLDAGAFPMRTRDGASLSWRAVSEGEDYELLFTVAGSAPVPSACPITGTPITCIGRVDDGPAGACVIVDGATEHDARTMGWEHR